MPRFRQRPFRLGIAAFRRFLCGDLVWSAPTVSPDRWHAHVRLISVLKPPRKTSPNLEAPHCWHKCNRVHQDRRDAYSAGLFRDVGGIQLHLFEGHLNAEIAGVDMQAREHLFRSSTVCLVSSLPPLVRLLCNGLFRCWATHRRCLCVQTERRHIFTAMPRPPVQSRNSMLRMQTVWR